jgi:peptide/nickel transport system substrate-binding protein
MAFSISTKKLGKTVLGAGLLLSMIILPNASANTAAHATKAQAASYPLLVVSDQQTGTWVKNFNVFNNTGARLDPTQAGIYEPLYMVMTVDNAKQVPWLATSYAWSTDLKTLTFTIRDGVKWSDGQPLTAADVLYTLNLGKTCAACDVLGLWGTTGIATAASATATTVSVTFKAVNTTIFPFFVNNLFIVPQHIWSKQADPANWTNADPVGSGPFTQVTNFTPQSYDLLPNQYYWQKVNVSGLRYVNHTGNDSTLLDFKAGKIDWGGHFFAGIQNTLDKAGPQFHHYYSYKSTPVLLYFNNQKYPFSIPALRQALSMSINRAALANSAEYAYTIGAECTGIGALYPTWLDSSLKAKANALCAYDPKGAKALLLKSGFTYKGTALMDPKGNAVNFDILTVNGWTDWDAGAQIMASNFGDIGVDAGMRMVSFGTYSAALTSGNYDTVMSWADKQATPYTYFYDQMSSNVYKPNGTNFAAGRPIERYKNAAVDPLFTAISTTTDSAAQHAAMAKIEAIWLNDLPAAPLFYGDIWGEYSTANYTGFPNGSNYYAELQTATIPDRLLVFTKLTRSHS